MNDSTRKTNFKEQNIGVKTKPKIFETNLKTVPFIGSKKLEFDKTKRMQSSSIHQQGSPPNSTNKINQAPL